MSIIVALLVFTVLVVIHEFGHYIAAVKNGVPVEEFAIGMGPIIFKRPGKKTLFSIRLFPIGGFCKMVGEDEESDDENALGNKTVLQRIVIVAAGATFNIISAILILIVISNFEAVSVKTVKEVIEDSPAMEAGLLKGDEIIAVNGQKTPLMDDVRFIIALDSSKDQKLDFKVKREGKEIIIPINYDVNLAITDVKGIESENLKAGTYVNEINGKSLGEIASLEKELKSEVVKVKVDSKDEEITLTAEEVKILNANRPNISKSIGIIPDSKKLNVFESFGYGIQKTRYYAYSTFKSLGLMVTAKVSKDQVAGPVGIMKIIGDTYENSIVIGFGTMILSLLNFAAMLSVNLGIINLLPLPALDGGRLFFLFIELIRRKPIDPEKEGWVHFGGFVLLMVLMVVLLFNDVMRIIQF